ncbi:RNA deprotection pyrophosphohydrolase [Pueribacillus sp. YX66]|uniref:RNA deprotection pyrophosphohydrolase n=1 Tax=Pueribacillus sp. YX66 TaxID=3229242 RepID=UPI00358CE86A
MITFSDYYRNKVQLCFEKHPFSNDPRHVWIICRYSEQWLLTEHRSRGLEFPGGKVEDGETPIEAAIREVNEETGGIVQSIVYLGQYKVEGKAETIIKNIYFAHIESLQRKDDYFETRGPVLLKKLPKQIKSDHRFSFIMKDGVLSYSLQRIKKLIL